MTKENKITRLCNILRIYFHVDESTAASMSYAVH